MINQEWAEAKKTNRVDHHGRSGSDHSLIIFKFRNPNHSAIRYFRFLNFWTKQGDYLNLVENIWNTDIQENGQWVLQQKLKVVAKGLSAWSRDTIGDIFASVKQKDEKVGLLEQIYEDNNTDSNRQSIHKAQAKYTRWLKMQDSILKQKARIRWVDEGDTNSKYFYSVIKTKKGGHTYIESKTTKAHG